MVLFIDVALAIGLLVCSALFLVVGVWAPPYWGIRRGIAVQLDRGTLALVFFTSGLMLGCGLVPLMKLLITSIVR